MAHDYKLAPVLNDNTNYIDWCKELDVWVKLTELPEEKKALAIFSSLRGKAKKAALQLEVKDLKLRGGVIKLEEKLDTAFSKDKKKASYDDYEKFERFKLSNEMSLAEYTTEFEELFYCLEKYEINLPPVVLAYRYLNSANLKEVQSTIVRTTISDYTYDNMVKQVKAVFSESKQEQSEEKIKVKVEDESYELEETFYSNMRNNERDNFRGKGQVRGSYRDKYKDGRKRGERQTNH